jgi:hypothetical protein
MYNRPVNYKDESYKGLSSRRVVEPKLGLRVSCDLLAWETTLILGASWIVGPGGVVLDDEGQRLTFARYKSYSSLTPEAVCTLYTSDSLLTPAYHTDSG